MSTALNVRVLTEQAVAQKQGVPVSALIGVALLLALAPGCDDPTAPEDEGGPEFVQVAAGAFHACARTERGVIYCWGSNLSGQLGTFEREASPVPARIMLPTEAVYIAAGGRTTCAILIDDAIYCWGDNSSGQAGIGELGTKPRRPWFLPDAPPLQSLVISERNTCGLDGDGRLYCWGAGRNSQLGYAPTEPCGLWPCASAPVPVHHEISFRQVTMGMRHVCGIRTKGVTVCWGWNAFQQLGREEVRAESVPDPVTVSGNFTFESVAGGVVQTCGLRASGEVHCWGTGFWGSLGRPGDEVSSPHPVRLEGLRASFLSPSSEHSIFASSCALDRAGRAYCWGSGFQGSLGSEAAETYCTHLDFPPFPCSSAPLPVEGKLTFQSLQTGADFTCGLTIAQRIYCWGANGKGQLGDGTTTSRSTPMPVAQPKH